jgi:iron-sulfur cluster repair protein YtfE (RIC family)
VKDFLTKPETAQGRALYQELLGVHAALRRDLASVRRLAQECRDGRAAEKLQEEIAELESNSPLWRLKIGCLHYCRFVEAHHGAEDALLFPRLRQLNPEVGPIVDRLEGDHRKVAEDIVAVEEAAQALTGTDSVNARERLATGLDTLGDDLLAHLDFEEKSLEPTLSRLETWPPG